MGLDDLNDEDQPIEAQVWMRDRRCRDTDPSFFYPTGASGVQEAKRYCHGCPVRLECLAHALSRGEKFGVWGGTSERERRRMRKAAWLELQLRTA